MSTHSFLEHIDRTALQLREHLPARAAIVHHNDSDGLTSGFITATLFERLRVPFSRYCLERTYPEALERIVRGFEGLTAVVDFGSGVLPHLSQCRAPHGSVLVLDHHHITACDDPAITVVNGRAFGVDGNRDCSAATTAYLFARSVSAHNTDLAWRALAGALGDRQLLDGRFTGLNAAVFEDARTRGDAEFHEGRYLLQPSRRELAALVRALDSMGSAGYFSNGPARALAGLAEMPGDDFFSEAHAFEHALAIAVAATLDKQPVAITNCLQHLTVGEECRGMGVKTAGLVAERFAESSDADPHRYVAVFQTVPAEIPGLGSVLKDRVKVSFRVPPALAAAVREHKAPSLTLLVPAATTALGGAVDGCHDLAAATVINAGQETELVAAFEEAFERFSGAHA